MKNLVFVAAWLVLSFLSSAYAYPTVGDQLTMKGTLDLGKNLRANVTYVFDMLEISEKEQKVTYTVTGLLNDEAPVADIHKEAKVGVFSKEFLKQVLTEQGCAYNGVPGELEKITVGFGELLTCKVKIPDGHVWISDIPFGYAKIETINERGELFKITAESFFDASTEKPKSVQ